MSLYHSELLASWFQKIFKLLFFYYESMKANDPLGHRQLGVHGHGWHHLHLCRGSLDIAIYYTWA